jgi:hypothetical protein
MRSIVCTNPLVEFEQVIDTIVGVYIDATLGFDIYQSRLSEITKNSLPSARIFYGDGDPNDPTTIASHVAPISEVISRNTKTGNNFRFIGNMCLISIYQYWEDNYRAKIARLFQKDKNALKEPIMGDIRLLRNSIIHHNAIAKKDVENCTLLRWYTEGDEIFITKEQFHEIVNHVCAYIKRLKSEQVSMT